MNTHASPTLAALLDERRGRSDARAQLRCAASSGAF